MDLILACGIYMTVLAWVVAFLAFAANPGRPINRIIAALVFAEGLAGGMFRMVRAWPDNFDFAGRAVGTMALFCLIPLYPLFLGMALNTPLVAFWRRPAVRRVLYGFLVVAFILPVAVPALFSGSLWLPLNRSLSVVVAIEMLYSFFAALSAFRRAAAGSVARRNAKWYLIAFASRDLIGAPLLIVVALAAGRLGEAQLQLIVAIGFSIAATLYLPLLAYAMFRGHMFDIDLKIKWAVSRGTVAALFLACFLIVAKLAEAVADRYVGGQAWVLGAVAAGLLLFALTPLQRFAERLADQAMPTTTGSPEYVLFKKLEVYRSTAESVLLDGSLSERDRRILDALREKLAIDPAAAEALERDAGVPSARHVSHKTAAA